MQKVVLSDNKIMWIPFLPASLIVLNLDFNQLKSIDSECLSSCRILRYLSLKYNKLEELPSTVFDLSFL